MMTTDNVTRAEALPEVIHADREAAAAIYDLLGFGPCQHIIDGVEDDIGVVPIIARHRLAFAKDATPSASVERMREAADGLFLAMTTRALRGYAHVPSMRDEQDARRKLAAALATLPVPSAPQGGE